MKNEILIKFCLAFVIGSICTSISFSQAARGETAPTKKANKRPVEKPVEKKKPTFANGKTDDGIETDDEVLTINTDLVTLPVRVLDRQGRFISGIKKGEFSLFEDKAQQRIEYFSNEQSPFTVALILDMSYSSTFKINEIQQAALTFITQLRPNDKVMVISFNQEINVLSEPTSDRKKLEQAIIRTSIGSGTSLYETVDFVLNKRLSKIQGRKAIVLFTDGVDTTSRSAHDRNNLNDALEYDALVYPIRYDTYADVRAIEDGKVIIQDPNAKTTPPIGGGTIPTGNKNPLPFPLPTGTIGTGRRVPSRIPGSGTTKEEYVHAERYLNEMAMRTGGRVYQANDPGRLAVAFSKIASELREFYSIGYYPEREGKSPTKRRKIKVKVDRKKVAVRTRDSYVLGIKKLKK